MSPITARMIDTGNAVLAIIVILLLLGGAAAYSLWQLRQTARDLDEDRESE